jgi:hypothetical protein
MHPAINRRQLSSNQRKRSKRHAVTCIYQQGLGKVRFYPSFSRVPVEFGVV